jgi:hypothetical protein
MDMDLPFYVICVTKGRERKGKFLAAFAEKPLAEEYARYLCRADNSDSREYLAVDKDVALVHTLVHSRSAR